MDDYRTNPTFVRPASGGEIPQADELVQHIYQELTQKGVAPGIAWQQAQSLRHQMYNNVVGDTNSLSLLNDAQSGYTALNPHQLLTARQIFADPAEAQQNAEAFKDSPTATRLINRGARSWQNADPGTAYQQAIQVMTEQIRAEARANGQALDFSTARQIAERHLGNQDDFRASLNIANSPSSSGHLSSNANELGSNLGFGAGMHMLSDTFMPPTEGAVRTGWRGAYDDLKESLNPLGGTNSFGAKLQQAKGNIANALHGPIPEGLTAADRPGLVQKARQEFSALVSSGGTAKGLLGRAVPGVMNSFPAIFGVQKAFGENINGETAGEFAKRLGGFGLPGNLNHTNVDDWITAGSAIPHAAAQGYMFNTLPRELAQSFHGPLGPWAGGMRAVAKGNLVSELPGAATSLARLAFGTDRGQRHEANRVLDEEAAMDRRAAAGGITTNMTPWGDGGAFEGGSNKGLPGMWKNRFRGASPLDILGGTLETATRAAGAYPSLIAHGIGSAADLVGSGVNTLAGHELVSPRFGTELRSVADPATMVSAGRRWFSHGIANLKGTTLDAIGNKQVTDRLPAEAAETNAANRLIDQNARKAVQRVH